MHTRSEELPPKFAAVHTRCLHTVITLWLQLCCFTHILLNRKDSPSVLVSYAASQLHHRTFGI